MSFPTVVGTASWDCGNVATPNVMVAIPAGAQPGDLLIAFAMKSGSTGVGTATAAFTRMSVFALASGYGAAWFWHVIDGSEGAGPIQCSTISSDRCGTLSFLVRALSGSPTDNAGVQTASSATTDPAALTPAGGLADYLWLTASVINAAGRTATPPSGYGGQISLNANAGPGSISAAYRTNSAASEDPGVWTWSGAVLTPTANVVAIAGITTSAARSFGMVT